MKDEVRKPGFQISPMPLVVTVIVCTHNPRPDYLGQCLDALSSQTLPKSQWELVIVDNRSDLPLTGRIDLHWHECSRLIREEKLGLTPARLRGIREAKGDLLVFVDDDNVLDPDFLEQVVKIAEEWPQLGSWSGQTRPGFEVEPPAWTRRYWGSLAIRSLERDIWSNLPHLPETMPCGAGLCVRRVVAERYTFLHLSGQRKVLLDRSGDSLASAGDNDLAACACDVGLGVGLFPALRLVHLLPPSRLEEQYLIRLIEGIAYSAVVFRSFRSEEISPGERSWARKLADRLRLIRMSPRERKFWRATMRGEARAVELLVQQALRKPPDTAGNHRADRHANGRADVSI